MRRAITVISTSVFSRQRSHLAARTNRDSQASITPTEEAGAFPNSPTVQTFVDSAAIEVWLRQDFATFGNF
jgi:hypothetical protein